MHAPSPEVIAAIRAMRGESDLDAVRQALVVERLAQIIACAPDAHPVVGAIAALCGDLAIVLDERTIADSDVHAALRRLIGTREGSSALAAWATVAPVGWGRAFAADRIDAVNHATWVWGSAAALIGPCAETAAVLQNAGSIAFAVRRWGQDDHADPTWWTSHVPIDEQERFVRTLIPFPSCLAACLPWLPSDVAHRMRLDENVIDAALDAFACASPTARTMHAAFLQHVIAHAQSENLGALTRLACVMEADDVWRRVQTLIRQSPDDAWRVVVAAPWDDLPEEVCAAILKRADRSDVCAAIAAARGRRDAATQPITEETAAAFVAALDPAVWDALDADEQQRWFQALRAWHIPLAIRSLGLRPAILARAPLDVNLVRAAQRHTHDAAALRTALLPVALRAVDPDQAYALLSVMSSLPPDPGAFFCVANGVGDPRVIAPARVALHSPADLACAVIMQRSTERYDARMHDVHASLRHALHGRTWDDLAPFLALLTDAARADLTSAGDARVDHLAHRDHRDRMRAVIDRLALLPPEAAMPVRVALNQWERHEALASDAAAVIAAALRGHGDLALADALTDALRTIELPLPEENAALADALRAMMRDHPPTAQRLAYAIRTKLRRAALLALLTAPPRHAGAVWKALAETDRRAIVGELPAGTLEWTSPAECDSIATFALAAVHAPDVDLRAAGVTALAARPDVLRACWTALPLDARKMLRAHPAVADLQTAPERSATRRGLRR